MVKTHWVKRVAVLGTVFTLSLACYDMSNDVTASAAEVCQETEMAGISLSLDKYYTTNFVQNTVLDSNDSPDTITLEESTTPEETAIPEETIAPEETGAPAETAAPEKTATPAEKKTEKKKTKITKKKTTPKVSERWKTTGISIADNYVHIRRHPRIRDSKIIGKLYRGSAARILRTRKGGWVQIQSGSVKGYIKKEFLAIGADAEKLADKYGTKYITVKEGTITLNVRSRTSTKSTIVTQIPEEERFNVEKLCGDNWVRISLDDGRGYVAKEFVNVRVRFKKAISRKEEIAKERARIAAQKAEQERLRALAAAREAEEASYDEDDDDSSSSSSDYSSSGDSSSSSSGSSSSSSSSNSSSSSSESSSNSSSSGSTVNTSSYGSSTGAQIAEYAQQFVGCPYVYGGTSLRHGTDCSGFTMSVYAQFGYSIPRTSSAQSTYGTKVSLSNVKPGDLIFYKNGGSVGHVAMYIGGGSVVHASNHIDGIKISGMYYRQPCGARRIVG